MTKIERVILAKRMRDVRQTRLEAAIKGAFPKGYLACHNKGGAAIDVYVLAFFGRADLRAQSKKRKKAMDSLLSFFAETAMTLTPAEMEHLEQAAFARGVRHGIVAATVFKDALPLVESKVRRIIRAAWIEECALAERINLK